MNMQLIYINTQIPEEIKNLYEMSFPETERRPWDKQLTLFNEKKINLSKIVAEGIFAGFVFYWQLEDVVFIEHFAVDPSTRGKGIGSKIMDLFSEEFKSIVLEVEPEEKGVDAVRRINFYEKLGYEKFPFHYEQPPYTSETGFLKMYLLCKGMNNDIHSFQKIKSMLYSTVYRAEINE